MLPSAGVSRTTKVWSVGAGGSFERHTAKLQRAEWPETESQAPMWKSTARRNGFAQLKSYKASVSWRQQTLERWASLCWKKPRRRKRCPKKRRR